MTKITSGNVILHQHFARICSFYSQMRSWKIFENRFVNHQVKIEFGTRRLWYVNPVPFAHTLTSFHIE